MDKISTLVALLAAMSVAVERVVEIIKGSIPALASTWERGEGLRRTLIQVLSVGVGAVIAWQMPSQLSNAIGSPPDWKVDLLFGLLASGGSGLWNHALDIVRATKVNQENKLVASTPGTGKPQAQAATGSI